MSERRPKRLWRCYVRDMIGFCDHILEDTADAVDRQSLVAERSRYDAVRYNLILLGEAVTNVPDQVRARHAEVPWRDIVATRNRLIHGYPGVDPGIVWQTVANDIPALQDALEWLLEAEGEDGE